MNKQFLQQRDPVKYYSFNSRLSKDDEEILNRDFHVKYFLTVECSSLTSIPSDHVIGKDLSISHTLTQSDLIQFTDETFYRPNRLHYDNMDITKFKDDAVSYIRLNPFSVSYRKQENLIALLVAHKYESHPAINQPTLHVGYWSYKRDFLNIDEARFIKESWFEHLKQWATECGSETIDVSVDYFNEPAFRMVFSRGFKIRALRLDRRPKCD